MKLTSKGNTQQKIIYGSDVLALTEGVQSYKALFKQRYRWKLGMLQNLLNINLWLEILAQCIAKH